MSQQLVWVITGTSSGIGRELCLVALERGDKVIATTRARSFKALADLKAKGADVLELDVTSPLETLHAIANEAVKIYGRVDVLVNNAGAYSAVGALEDQTPEETLNQFNINLFGPLNVARAFLPYMRERRSGTIAWTGSVGGWVHLPNSGVYCATKHAMREISEGLNADMGMLGIRSICFELGFFRTEFLTPSNRAPLTQRIADYKELAETTDAFYQSVHHNQPGDTEKCVNVIADAIRGEGVAEGKEVPPVFAIGRDCYHMVKQTCETTLGRLEEWKDVIISTDISTENARVPEFGDIGLHAN